MLLDPKIGTADKCPAEGVATDTRRATLQSGAWSVVPWILALFFLFWSLRMVGAGSVVDTDAARHAMNGAFVHDAIASGNLLRILDYGREYYGKLPALSMPYHPPMVPVLESVVFSILGVNLFAARLLIAFTVGLSVFLLYSLVMRTWKSNWVALAVTATFFFWPISQVVGGDVMLEFPSLAFLLAALHCLLSALQGAPRYYAAFAVLSSAAFWSKQHSVFLIAVPFAWIAVTRNWRHLQSIYLWISTVIIGVAAYALSLLSKPFHSAGVNQVIFETDNSWLEDVVWHNLVFYVQTFPSMITPLARVVLICALVTVAVVVWTKNQKLALYVAWAIPMFALLLNLGPFDIRYMFFAFPAILVLGFAAIEWLAERFLPRTASWAPLTACVLYAIVLGVRSTPPYLRGPSEMAQSVVAHQPRKILYCGSADGNFIFSIRSLDPALRTTVILGEKVLLNGHFSGQELQRVAEASGLGYLVVEHTQREQPCNALEPAALDTMKLEKTIRMASSLPRFDGGSLMLYRYTGPVAPGQEILKMDLPQIGTSVEIKN